MITIETRPVRFGELSQKAKQHARENWQALDDWWTHTYGDAASVGIEIKSFDIERGEIDGGLLRHTHADDSAKLILANHGQTCDTYQTALKFMASYVLVDHNEDDEDWGGIVRRLQPLRSVQKRHSERLSRHAKNRIGIS